MSFDGPRTTRIILEPSEISRPRVWRRKQYSALTIWVCLVTAVALGNPDTKTKLPRVLGGESLIKPDQHNKKKSAFIPVGVNSPHECRQSGYLYQAWTLDDLVLGITVNDLKFVFPRYDAYYCDGLAVYLDGRSETLLNHAPYSSGSGKLIVYPGSDGSTKALWQNFGEPDKPALAIPIDGTFIRTKDGWEGEIRIPWKLINFTPHEGAKLGLGVRLLDSGDPLIPGQESSDTTTTGIDPENDPMALNVVTLAGASAASNYTVEFEEVFECGQFQLHGTVFAPPPISDIPKSLTVEIQGKTILLPWHFSSGGEFRLAEFNIPITPELAARANLPAIIRESDAPPNSTPVWSDDIPLPVARMRQWTTTEFAKIKSNHVEQQTAELIEYLEELAEDAALRNLKGSSNLWHIAEGHPEDYTDPAIPIIVQAAQSLLDPGVAASVTERLHVWRSKLDGTWQIFQVTLPLDYNPKKKWPIEIIFHPLFNKLEAVNNVHLLARAESGVAQHFFGRVFDFDAGPIPYQGDRIRITLWGRGNSFQELGEEEFLHALDYGMNTLGGDVNSVILKGHSDGATDTLLYAERYSDRVAAMDLLSGGYISRILAPEGRLAPPEARVLSPMYDMLGQPDLLRGISGRVSIGADDRDFLTAAIRLQQALNYKQSRSIVNNSPIAFNVIPRTGHIYDLPPLQPTTLKRPLATAADPVIFGSSDLRYASKDGLTVDSIGSFGHPWRIGAYVSPDHVLTIDARNLTGFSYTAPSKNPFRGAEKIQIDGENMGAIAPNSNRFAFIERLGKWQRTDGPEAETAGTKTPRCSGPILDIRRRPYLIVCGTRDPDAAPRIHARAVAIGQELFGWHNNQNEGGRLQVVDDIECTKDMREGKSIWLIGNRDENALYDELAGQSPIEVGNGRIQFGSKDLDASVATLAAFIGPNPAHDGNYVFVEAATASEGYIGPIFESRAFDFVINTVDLRDNPIVVRGLFDEHWQIRTDTTFWRK